MPTTCPFIVIIPARLASSRLPNKPLADIHGKPMVIRVAEQAIASGAAEVIIATDAPSIYKVAQAHHINVQMTKASHLSGTDRLAEVAQQQNYPDETIIVNVQGDEPLIEPKLIAQLADHLNQHPLCAIATLACPIHDIQEVFNPNIVKVVLNANQQALYFSRAPIPWNRNQYTEKNIAALSTDQHHCPTYRHIGLYAYRAKFLKEYSQLSPSPLEQMESLEQLRALWHQKVITVLITHQAPAHGVDTQSDLDHVRAIFTAQK